VKREIINAQFDKEKTAFVIAQADAILLEIARQVSAPDPKRVPKAASEVKTNFITNAGA
jgi:hypothetical protein